MQSSAPSSTYELGHDPRDFERLQVLAEIFDSDSHATLLAAGLTEGWRCLEVGAGSGSIARWMHDIVGPTGSVCATDVHTKGLAANLRSSEVRVLVHDIRTDPLPSEAYDLVHVRMVLEHTGSAPQVLEKLFGCLTPGGRVVVEEIDKTSSSVISAPAPFRALHAGIAAAMKPAGFDPHMGRRLPQLLRSAGFHSVSATGKMRITCGDEDTFKQKEMYERIARQLRSRLHEVGLTDADVEAGLHCLMSPDVVLMGSTLISAVGHRLS